MNYYPHHIGDYLRDTAHLTAIEDGIYRRMLDVYYASEKPLPIDRDWLCRLLRATEEPSRLAVDILLREFFERKEDGWHNKRCDIEIRKSRARHKAAITNGKRGGRPRTQDKPSGLSLGSQKKAPQNQNQILTPDGFEELWAMYPRRAGGNPKQRALAAYRARLGEGHGKDEILGGARRYADFVRATGKEGSEYVKQTASFLGPEKHFLEPWSLPNKADVSPLYRREGAM